MKTILKVQGQLVKVKTPKLPKENYEPPKRGKVTGFSRKSRKRLLELFASLKPQKKTVFITLTYPATFPDAKAAKAHLRAFLERLRRLSDTACGVWRLEFQKRGAPHFHLIMWNLPFIAKETIQQMWGEIIDHAKPFTRIELILTSRKVMSYVSKYVAKATALKAQRGFNHEPYPHAGASAAENGEPDASQETGSQFESDPNSDLYESAGRVWGCFNKDLFPFDEPVEIEIEMKPAQFLALRAVAKACFPGLNDEYPFTGFSLFVNDAYEWIDTLQEVYFFTATT